ncbi:TonB-dependent receptor, partial [Caulobacter sp. S45]|uniref:TonB-dependent receptor n=1 Tax=Caulobacter sp. S45 TaxID=1641861 RepID=UPI00157699FE
MAGRTMGTGGIAGRRGALARGTSGRLDAVLAAVLLAAAVLQPASAQTGQPAAPATAPDADEPATTASTVTVTARRKPPPQPGAVVGDIKPELQLSPSDIRSFGVSTVTELLQELSPETRSDRGRGGETPVVLLNGRRISSFSEIQNIPTEAILRVDILPEEVSLKYGYTADQRVVNIVLRRRFNAVTGELQGGGPTEGGQATGQAEADLLRLRGDSRLNLDLKYQGQSNLTEADRDLTSIATGQPFDLAGNVVSPTSGGEIDPALSSAVGHPVTEAGVPAGLNGRAPTIADFAANAAAPNSTDVSGDRTLLSATQQVTANAVISRPIFWGLRATGNATLGATTGNSLQGLPGLTLLVPNGNPYSPFAEPVDVDRYASNLGPLRQSVDGWTAHLGTTLNKDTGDWRLSLTDAYDHADTTTTTDAGADATRLQALLNGGSASFNPFGALPANLVPALPQDTAHSRSDSGNIQILANGPLFKLPAGQFYASLKLGDTESLQTSTSTQAGLFQAASLSRNDVNAQANLDLPLTSREHHVFGFIGELSVNVNGAIDELSDFGLLKTLGYGINWTPIDGVNLIVSRTQDQAAPTIQQLAGPMVQTPGTRLFDYVTGQTVDVTQVAGGNPDLVADHRQVTKVGLTWKPIPHKELILTANYIVSHISNPIATFPAVDAQIEAAFPGRFIRDSDGTLTEEDDRAVNFASQDRQELRWGFNYSQPLGPQPPPRDFRRLRRNRDVAAGTANAGAAGGKAG